jgi:hypothetical protein
LQTGWSTTERGVRLTFSCDLNPASAADPESYAVSMANIGEIKDWVDLAPWDAPWFAPVCCTGLSAVGRNVGSDGCPWAWA